jgi:malate permease and related proteins
MQSAVAAIEALLILFLMGAFGWALRSRRLVMPAAVPALSAIALDFALPCLVFVVILNRFHPADMPGWHDLPIAWALFTLVALPMSLAAGFAARPSLRREFRLCCFYQNALFFPLAILTEMFGADSGAVLQLFLMTFIFPAFFFNTYAMFFRGSLRLDWRKTLHPVLLTTMAAVLICLGGFTSQLPDVLLKAMQQVGAVSVPLLMILLGARIREDYENRGPIYWREIIAFIGIRNVIFPLLFLAVFPVLNVSRDVGFLLLLQTAMPPVTAAPIVVGRESGNATFASQLLLTSYVAATISIPLMVWLFGLLFGT